MRCVWVEAYRRQRAHPGRPSRRWARCSSRSISACRAAPPGCAWCASAPGELRRDVRGRAGTGLPAADPARPYLPGPLRARAARRAVRGHQRARAAGFRRSGGRLPARARLRRLCRRDQRHRRQRRQLPHVESRGVRAADARRLCAGHADLLPRQEPHRHPGRHSRRRRHGRVQHAVPDRRRRAGGRSSAGASRCSIWTACRCSRSRARCATSIIFRAAARSASRRACCSAPRRTRSALPHRTGARSGWPRRSPPARSSSRRSTATTCRCCGPSWSRSRTSACSARCSSWSASARCARRRRRSGCASTFPACTFPTRVIARLAGAQDQAREGRNICIELIQEIREIRGVQRRARHGLPPGRVGRRDRRALRRASTAALPWYPGARRRTANLNRTAS